MHIEITKSLNSDSDWRGRRKGGDYVAISHVWSDGHANPSMNKLPRCQLEQIQRRVDRLFSKGKKSVPFWIDSLMIPVENGKTENTEVKREAIRQMEYI